MNIWWSEMLQALAQRRIPATFDDPAASEHVHTTWHVVSDIAIAKLLYTSLQSSRSRDTAASITHQQACALA
ncbi:hypothetical protein HBI46_195180 [Parastagonospora nodorum]|nr:hypothetical protein HBI71_206910 [Parastagonospora nodorum]KAH5406160.1 hypothetical protein HBI46_195180 [Parastagonospora nodorum]KAH5760836.1 hypothetical protein HBI16_184830 [Parastagonospora nodorum]KAH6100598.1 hypothetical protein HBI69_220390 [Parastagonospora nodorum]